MDFECPAVARCPSIGNERLALQVRSQEEEIASIERQPQEIETTSREIQPLMQSMVQALEQFVMLDVPFMLEERLRRVANLEEITRNGH